MASNNRSHEPGCELFLARVLSLLLMKLLLVAVVLWARACALLVFAFLFVLVPIFVPILVFGHVPAELTHCWWVSPRSGPHPTTLVVRVVMLTTSVYR